MCDVRRGFHSGTFNEPRKFIGEEYDSETSLSYLNARYYDGGRGQFVSEDPVHLTIGDSRALEAITGQQQQVYLSDPQQLNSYSYARNNPVVNKDPTGNQVVETAALVATAPEWVPALTGAALVVSTAVTVAVRNADKLIWAGPRQIPSPESLGIPPRGEFNPGNWNPKVPKWMWWAGAGLITIDRAASIVQDFEDARDAARDFNSRSPALPPRSGQPTLYLTNLPMSNATISRPDNERRTAEISRQLQSKLSQLSTALTSLGSQLQR